MGLREKIGEVVENVDMARYVALVFFLFTTAGLIMLMFAFDNLDDEYLPGGPFSVLALWMLSYGVGAFIMLSLIYRSYWKQKLSEKREGVDSNDHGAID